MDDDVICEWELSICESIKLVASLPMVYVFPDPVWPYASIVALYLKNKKEDDSKSRDRRGIVRFPDKQIYSTIDF
jgi:hypothetical protein